MIKQKINYKSNQNLKYCFSLYPNSSVHIFLTNWFIGPGPQLQTSTSYPEGNFESISLLIKPENPVQSLGGYHKIKKNIKSKSIIKKYIIQSEIKIKFFLFLGVFQFI
jgi:hypothetical protein